VYSRRVDSSVLVFSLYKIRKYRDDYNNNPPNDISFMSTITSTSGRLHSEFVDFYFYKFIGKLTDFLQLQEFNLWNITVTRNCTLPFHVLTKISFLIWKPKNCRSATALKEEDDEKCPVPLPSRGVLLTTQIQDWEHSRQDYSINLVSIFRCSSPPINPVYVTRVDPSPLVFISILSHRHSFIFFSPLFFFRLSR
jgi:hypothetical protein